MGDKEEGRQLLEELLESDEGNEQVWLWLSTVVDTDEDREVCLENVLALNPGNAIAQKSLTDLRSGRFSTRDIMSAALGEVEEGDEPGSGATFIEEFHRAAEDEEEFDDQELVMPSTMAKSKPKAQQKKQGAGFKINPRLIILAVLVLLIICALALAAAYNLFLGGGSPSGEQIEQETPAGGGEVPPTEAPPPAEATPILPTDTPTPTRVPLELPTPKPTDLPTPTATQVVAPTP
jgi:hypothetical protein